MIHSALSRFSGTFLNSRDILDCGAIVGLTAVTLLKTPFGSIRFPDIPDSEHHTPAAEPSGSRMRSPCPGKISLISVHSPIFILMYLYYTKNIKNAYNVFRNNIRKSVRFSTQPCFLFHVADPASGSISMEGNLPEQLRFDLPFCLHAWQTVFLHIPSFYFACFFLCRKEKPYYHAILCCDLY